MKKPDIHVIVADSFCCGWLNHSPKAPAKPIHWDDKKKRWVRCRIRAYWKLVPKCRVRVS